MHCIKCTSHSVTGWLYACGVVACCTLCDSQWQEALPSTTSRHNRLTKTHWWWISSLLQRCTAGEVSCGLLLWAREVVHYTAREGVFFCFFFDLPPGAIQPRSAAPMAGSHRMDVSVLQWPSHSQLGMLGCKIRLIKSTHVWSNPAKKKKKNPTHSQLIRCTLMT